jgi:hypothetical protein
MDDLIARNRSGELRSGPDGRGFYADGRRCRGVTKLLNVHVRGDTSAALGRVERRGWRTMASSRATGAIVHRVLMHGIVCASGGSCVCVDGGAAGPPSQRVASYAYSRVCLAAAKAFLRGAGLTPVAGELVAAHPRFPVATRIDLVCHDAAQRVVVVSWKTGGGAANAVEMRRHKTQVAFEWSLVEAAGQRVASAHVVYVGGMIRGGSVVPYHYAHGVDRAEARALADSFAGRLERRFFRTRPS